MDSKVIELRGALLAFALLATVFVLWPETDLAVASLFYQNAWIGTGNPLVDGAYRGLPYVGRGLVALLLLLWLLTFLPHFAALRGQRLLFAFLLSGALAGPVLIVDAGLKNHLGRARPAQTEMFGGTRAYTPAFVPSDQCRNNCSFVSGHVATTAFIMVFGWLGSPCIRRRWLLISVAAAAGMGLVRMSAGGHFLSDCLFAWFATYFGLWLVELAYARVYWLALARDAFVALAGVVGERFVGAPSRLMGNPFPVGPKG